MTKKNGLSKMEAIFHEQQDGSLCAQHCLNSLLQGQFYSAVDLADMATELDTMEKLRMAEMGEDTPEYRQFIQVCQIIIVTINMYEQTL